MPQRFKLGRTPRKFGNVFHYSQMKAMLRASGTPLPALLPEVDNTIHLPADLGMMMNGPDDADPTLPVLGDCTSAAPAHIIQVVSSGAQGVMMTPPNDAVARFYQETGHWVPGDPSTDNGANMQDVMAWLNSTGYPMADGSRHRPLSPPIEISVTNITDVCEAVQEFGFVDIGMQVAQEFMEIGPPDLWDVDQRYQTIEGGHCVAIPKLKWSPDRKSVTFGVISWGTHQWQMTQAFWEKFVDECYTWVDPLWIANTGKTPLGLTVAQLEAIRVVGNPVT